MSWKRKGGWVPIYLIIRSALWALNFLCVCVCMCERERERELFEHGGGFFIAVVGRVFDHIANGS